MNNQQEDPFKQFGYGLASVSTLFVIEFAVFVYDIVSKALTEAVKTLPQSGTTNSYLINFSSYIALFIIIGIVQSLLVGLMASKPYIFGFLVGDAIITFILWSYLWDIIPSVVIGMASGFLIVIGCLIFRLHFEKPNYGYREF